MSGAITIRRALEASGLVPVDAQALLAHALKKDRAWLAAHASDVIDPAQAGTFFALAQRRRDGEPVAYLTGVREFWGLSLAVSPAVLIPRPETETLVESAIAFLQADRETRVLDLGTGSGAIALAIVHERPQARVLATDISPEALALAADNARRLSLANVEWLRSNWYADVPLIYRGAPFDLIVSNPPYVAPGDPHLTQGDLRYEPPLALSTAGDGLDPIRQIAGGATERLAPGGGLIIEHGHDQASAVASILTGAGFKDIASVRDLAGIPRVAAARR